jgi:hypothetical protein
MSADGQWRDSASSKSCSSRLVAHERAAHRDLAVAESSLRNLQGEFVATYEKVCAMVDRLRSSKNFSRTKMSNFRVQIRRAMCLFSVANDSLGDLSGGLLDGSVHRHLRVLYGENIDAYQAALNDLLLHVVLHIERDGKAARVQVQHLLRLRRLVDGVAAAFAAAVAPLSLALSLRMQPIVNQRENFFRAQMTNVAAKGPRIIALRNEMHQMIERRKVLETGANNLDRMFEVILKFKSAVGIEEEDDDEKEDERGTGQLEDEQPVMTFEGLFDF